MARARAVAEIEALPEADRLDGVPHPRETQTLFGHKAAERTLAEALASGRMHHGWLLAGRDGIGKATLAYRFARAALASPDERDPTSESLVVSDDTIASHQVRALSIRDCLSSVEPSTSKRSASPPQSLSTQCDACARFWHIVRPKTPGASSSLIKQTN